MSRLILLAAAIALPQTLLQAESDRCVPRTPCLTQKVECWKQRLSCLKPNINLPLRQACPPSRCIPILPRCEPSTFRVPTCIPKIGSCRTLCQPRCTTGCQPRTSFQERCRTMGEPVRRLLVPQATTSHFGPQNGVTHSLPVQPEPVTTLSRPATRVVIPNAAPDGAWRTIVVRPSVPPPPETPVLGAVPPQPGTPARVVVQQRAKDGNQDDVVRSLEVLVESRKAASVESGARLDELEGNLKRLSSKVDRLTKAVDRQNARLKNLEAPASN